MRAITRYQCDFCAKHYAHKRDARRHEKHCWRNPERTPRQGEVYGLDHDNGGKDWEPDGPGYNFRQEQDITGEYSPTGETWPTVDTGCAEAVPLNEAPRDSRVRWWKTRQMAAEWARMQIAGGAP